MFLIADLGIRWIMTDVTEVPVLIIIIIMYITINHLDLPLRFHSTLMVALVCSAIEKAVI